MPGEPGSNTTVQARDGVVTFPGLIVNASAQGQPIQVSGGGLAPASTAPINVTGSQNNNAISPSTPAPTIIGEQVVMFRKTNRRGKRVGKAVLEGFILDYSTAMNAVSAESAANYTISAATTRRIKRKKVTVFTPVTFKSTYNAATHSVTLTLAGKQTFAKGGQLTVVYAPPNGVSSAAGVALDPGDATFTIQRRAKGIAPG